MFGKKVLSLGAISMLSGCTLSDDDSIEKALMVMSRFNDRFQGWLFDPDKMAPTYSEEMITKPFPFNAYYEEHEIRPSPTNFKLKVSGLVRGKKDWTLLELGSLPQTSQVTRHICVEGWSAVGKWGGVRFSDFLASIEADTTARYVGFRCHDYHTSIDMQQLCMRRRYSRSPMLTKPCPQSTATRSSFGSPLSWGTRIRSTSRKFS